MIHLCYYVCVYYICILHIQLQMTYSHIIILTYICDLYLHLWDLGSVSSARVTKCENESQYPQTCLALDWTRNLIHVFCMVHPLCRRNLAVLMWRRTWHFQIQIFWDTPVEIDMLNPKIEVWMMIFVFEFGHFKIPRWFLLGLVAKVLMCFVGVFDEDDGFAIRKVTMFGTDRFRSEVVARHWWDSSASGWWTKLFLTPHWKEASWSCGISETTG